MRERDVAQLWPGDTIKLKHNLGEGPIIRVAPQRTKTLPKSAPVGGTYPMIQFRDKVTGAEVWATYLAVESYRLF